MFYNLDNYIYNYINYKINYPHLAYCNSIWCSGTKTTIGKPFIAQKKLWELSLLVSLRTKYMVSIFVYEGVKGRISVCEDIVPAL